MSNDAPTARELTETQERGIITSPRFESEDQAEAWIEGLDSQPERFVPAAKGKAAVDIIGEMPAEGSFNHLCPDFDVEAGVEITKPHHHFGIKAFESGYVVPLIADFQFAKKLADAEEHDQGLNDAKGG